MALIRIGMAGVIFMLAVGMTGCGGSDGGGNSTTQISGVAADGYLRGATVCLDLNNNGRCDADEPSGRTESGGAFTLDVTGYDPDAFTVVVEVTPETEDEDFGPVERGYTLRSPAGGYAFVSPLTTLVQTRIDQNPALDMNAAAQIVGLKLNVEDPDKLLADYIAGAEDSELQDLHKSAQVVARAFGEVAETLAQNEVLDQLSGEYELRAVQVATGKLLMSRLDEIAVAVQNGGQDFDPDSAAEGLNAGEAAGALSQDDIAIIAQQIAAADSAEQSVAGSVLPGATVYGFQEDGFQGPHTLIMVERFVYGQSAVELADAYDNEIENLDDLDSSEDEEEMGVDEEEDDDGGDAEDFSLNDENHIVFDGAFGAYHLTTIAAVDLAGLTFALDDLAQTMMQDEDLREQLVTFESGDRMYKTKAVYFPTNIAEAAGMLDEEKAEEDPDYAIGNSVADLKNYVNMRNINFPLDDHALIIGPKTYRKYFQPAAPGNVNGTLKGVRQGDPSDTIELGTYRIEALDNGRAYIVMDLLSFAEVNGVCDHVLIVNDNQDNHDFEEIVIADTAGSKSTEVIYFNRSAMEKIFTTVKANNP